MAERIIDCITFYDGLDILEIRLNCLAPYVDKFVICESPFDMLGKRKPLVFDENRQRFKDFNITSLIVADHDKHMDGWWTPYYYQLDYIMYGLVKVPDDAIILLSDFDEIPDLTDYKGEEGVFNQKLYYYYLNVFTGITNWKGTRALRKDHIATLSGHRRRRSKVNVIGTGWHFSYISSVEDIIKKIGAFCHRELNNDAVKNNIAENKKNLVDPYNRTPNKFKIEMPSGPKWLLENKERYEQLFYKE